MAYVWYEMQLSKKDSGNAQIPDLPRFDLIFMISKLRSVRNDHLTRNAKSACQPFPEKKLHHEIGQVSVSRD